MTGDGKLRCWGRRLSSPVAAPLFAVMASSHWIFVLAAVDLSI